MGLEIYTGLSYLPSTFSYINSLKIGRTDLIIPILKMKITESALNYFPKLKL